MTDLNSTCAENKTHTTAAEICAELDGDGHDVVSTKQREQV